MTYDSEHKSIRIPLAILAIAIGIFLSLLGTVYALTLQPLRDADAQAQMQIASIQQKNVVYDAQLSKMSANILLICNVQGVKCVQ